MEPQTDKINPKTNDIVLHVLFFISLGFSLWGSNIYKLTLIDTKYLLAIVAIGIIISFIALPIPIKTSYSIYWTVFLKAAIGGGIFYFGLLFLNQKFAGTQLLTKDFPIIQTGIAVEKQKVNGPQSYAIIDFYGSEKELIFYYYFSENDKLSPKVSLTYSKGLFGFNVIKYARLTN